MTQGADVLFTVKGFLFTKEKQEYDDPQDYFDFLTRTWMKEELYSDLKIGVLPVGLILATKGYQPVVVMPDTKGQKVIPIHEALNEGAK
jgi:hypothetical protein